MEANTISMLIFALVGGLGSALVVLFVLRPLQGGRLPDQLTRQAHAWIEFRDGHLTDANAEGESLWAALPEVNARHTDWDQIAHALIPRFPDLAVFDPKSPESDHMTLRASPDTDAGQLTLQTHGDRLHLDLFDPAGTPALRQALFQAKSELRVNQASMDCAPFPVWETDLKGNLIRANATYVSFAQQLGTPMDLGSLAPEPLFDLIPGMTTDFQDNRRRLTSEDGTATYWFDVHSEQVDGRWMHFAQNMNDAVKAEVARRNFVQTLTKTFAQLSIGLAIFDRNQQLALFNPALLDLTSLPSDFLSVRPDLNSFFDRLRDRSMMPEPKNYVSWRDQLTALISEASNGEYSETWTLPSGLTYRVSGRPHPDGAIAFLFEDISAEISLTRCFRSELELGRAVMDTMEEAVAVFSQLGTLTFTNQAYDDLWDDPTPNSFVEANVLNATRHWQTHSDPSPIWADIRDFVVEFGERAAWTATIRHQDGTELDARIVPLPGGSTMVGFLPRLPALPAAPQSDASPQLVRQKA